jgi:hypothetical protein
MVSRIALLAMAGSFAAAFGGTAQAASIIGLVDGKTLVMIDPASRKVTGTMPIKGADMLHGIDVRPADGMLYGLASGGNIVTIDPKTGQATMKSKLSETLKSTSDVTIDFNPAADRLRILTTDGTSLRVNVDDGKATVDGSLKYKEGDANAGKTPKVIAGSYTNSMKDTKATALYNIDAATGALVTQAPPNDGVLNTVGSLGMSVETPFAFNIVASGPEKNDAWLVAGGSLYSVDLKSGKATMAGKIEGVSGKLTDIAWWE